MFFIVFFVRPYKYLLITVWPNSVRGATAQRLRGTKKRQKREKGVTPIPAERVEEWLHCNSTNFCSTNKVIT